MNRADEKTSMRASLTQAMRLRAISRARSVACFNRRNDASVRRDSAPSPVSRRVNKHWLNAALPLLVTHVAAPARAECTKDIECKGDRICEHGQCVSGAPPSAAPAAIPAPEESRWNGGFEWGLRMGYMLPLGSVVATVPLSDDASGGIPTGLDAGWRINRRWFVGAYGSFALLFPFAKACPSSRTCPVGDVSFGAELGYHLRDFRDRGSWDPWLALGAGYELLFVTTQGTTGLSGPGVDRTYSGMQYLNAQLNVDYLSLSRGLVSPYGPAPDTIGLFLAMAVGEFTTGGDTRMGLHGWLTLGARLTWDVGR